MILLTLSLGLSVRRIMSAASNSRSLLVRKLLFFTISTTSFGLGVAEAIYQGLEGMGKWRVIVLNVGAKRRWINEWIHTLVLPSVPPKGGDQGAALWCGHWTASKGSNVLCMHGQNQHFPKGWQEAGGRGEPKICCQNTPFTVTVESVWAHVQVLRLSKESKWSAKHSITLSWHNDTEHNMSDRQLKNHGFSVHE